MLSPERQCAQMSKITTDSLTRSGTGWYSCTQLPIWYHKGVKEAWSETPKASKDWKQKGDSPPFPSRLGNPRSAETYNRGNWTKNYIALMYRRSLLQTKDLYITYTAGGQKPIHNHCQQSATFRSSLPLRHRPHRGVNPAGDRGTRPPPKKKMSNGER